MRDPLSVGVYKYPRTPNKIDEFLEREQKARTAAASKTKTVDAFEDIDKLGGVWERDIENLTNDFITFKKKRVEYEQEKDPTKKAQLWQEGVKLGAKLETNIEKSKINRKEYQVKNLDIEKDNKMLYPEDAKERLEKWASMSIYDRPDSMNIERPSTLDFIAEANKKVKALIGKPNIASDKFEDKARGRVVEKGEQYYDPDEVDRVLDATISSMPGNYIRSEKKRLQEQAVYGTLQEQQEARDALASDQALADYLKRITYAAIEPSLNVKIAKSAPIKKTKDGSGGGRAPKFQVGEPTDEMWGSTRYITLRSKKIGASQPEMTWEVPTYIIKDANTKLTLGLDDLTDIDPANTPSVSIQGKFLSLNKNTVTGDYTVTIAPTRYEDKFTTVEKPITIPLFGNETAVNSYLEGGDGRAIIEEHQKKKPTGTRGKSLETPTPKGATTSPSGSSTTPSNKNKKNEEEEFDPNIYLRKSSTPSNKK